MTAKQSSLDLFGLQKRKSDKNQKKEDKKTIKIGKTQFNILPDNHKFNFTCTHCGVCCRKVLIKLNPLDIIRICEKLKIKTFQLHKLTKFSINKKTGLPICTLKTSPQCTFLSKNKCLIYDERPFACRGYPVAMCSQGNFLYHTPGCQADKKNGKEYTIRKWMKKDEFNKHKIFHHKWIELSKKIAKNEKYKNTMENHQKFIKFFYDFDSKVYKKLTGKSLPKGAEKKFDFIIKMGEKEFLL